MTMIQIRNVPEDLHRSLKERAAREGAHTQIEVIVAG
jgi:plasmid stability protein